MNSEYAFSKFPWQFFCISGFQPGAVFPPRGHVMTPEDVLVVTLGGVLLVPESESESHSVVSDSL